MGRRCWATYFNLNKYQQSVEYCMLSIKLYKETGNNSYPNRIYATLGQNFAMLKNTDSALYFYNKGLIESKKLEDNYAAASIYGYMANTYVDRSDFKAMFKVAENL